MTAQQMLKRLVQAIDANCIVTPNDNDKLLVALDRSLVDQAARVANEEKSDERA